MTQTFKLNGYQLTRRHATGHLQVNYLSRGGILYQGSSGLWATAWIEAVPQVYLQDVRLTPDLDNSQVLVSALAVDAAQGNVVMAVVTDDSTKQVIGSATGHVGTEFQVLIPNVHPWSPADPYLYPVTIILFDSSVVTAPSVSHGSALSNRSLQGELDRFDSYTGMRKLSECRDVNGAARFCVNNDPTFLYGELAGLAPGGLLPVSLVSSCSTMPIKLSQRCQHWLCCQYSWAAT